MKTAVEWLEELIECGANLEQIKKCLPRAKKMEKEQIINAYEVGITRGMSYDEDIYHKKNWSSSEQYYNETFKSE